MIDFGRVALSPVQVSQPGHPNLAEREEDDLFTSPDLDGEPWYAEVNPRTVIPDPVERQFLSFPPPEAEDDGRAYENFVELCERGQCIGHLSAYTGLATYVYGDLWPEVQGVSTDHAEAFLNQYQLAFTGRSEPVRLVLVRVSQWPDETTQLAYQQVNAQDIPVSGASITLTYDADQRLVLAVSTLYPVPTEELPLFDSEPSAAELFEIVQGAIYATLEPQSLIIDAETQTPLIQRAILPVNVSQGDSSVAAAFERTLTQWVYTETGWEQRMDDEYPPDPNRSFYLPSLQIPFLDQYGHHWALWIDAYSREPINLTPQESHNDIAYRVFSRPGNAPNNPVNRMLRLGGTATLLKDAERVHVEGARFFDPGDHSLGALPGGDAREFLAANAFYHLWQTQYDFAGWFQRPNIEWATSTTLNQKTLMNPINDITAVLHDRAGSGTFIWSTGKIQLYTGYLTLNPPVVEPGFDGDVIVHECVHAILHYYYCLLFEHNTRDDALLTAIQSFDEALAFYFSCFRTQDPRWGEFSYATWGNRDFSVPIQPFTNLNQTAGIYDYALWWATILWKLGSILPANESLHMLLFKALGSLSNAVPSTESVHGTKPQRIFSLFNRIANAIYHNGTPIQHNRIAQIWPLCGFTIPV